MAKAQKGTTPAQGESAQILEVVTPDSPDVALTTTEGSAIQQFVQGARMFFRRALELETQATDMLVRAKHMALPTNSVEDMAVQSFIKAANSDKKAIDAHWEITTLVHRFHKRLVGRRSIGTTALEQAAQIGNDLHNRYVAAEKRRSQEEEERRRLAAEEDARLSRQRELDRLEQDALAREAASPSLSDREQMFVDLYVSTVNAQQSAQRAGYKDALKTSAKLMAMEKIAQAITAKQEAAAIRQQAVQVKHLPLEVEDVQVRPDIQKASNTSDRTTWTGEIYNEAEFIEAILSRRHGIPTDLLTIKPTVLNEYARSMHEALDRWPGVRAKKTTRVV